ncbi:MAG: ABC transporter ATP-binding protein [Bacteroidetes bacterium]|nr:ABC transporter ATP-binding protein [Bacteroidota bacterium]
METEKSPGSSAVTNGFSIDIKNLTKKFGAFTAVDDVSFSVKKGEIFGFLGPNGSGKSTTIRMLCGLMSPTSGTAEVAGFDINQNPEQVKTKIGYMSQRFSLYNDITVSQNIDFWGTLYKVSASDMKERKETLIADLNLEDWKNRLTQTLPGGIKQRLALGCAMLHQPEIIFLDEPTGGVDPVSRRNFWSVIDQLSASGTTVFVTTHFLDEAEYCQNVGMIYNAKLIALGSPTALRENTFKETSIELDVSNPMEAVSIIPDHPDVAESSIFGNLVHAILKPGISWSPDVETSFRTFLENRHLVLKSAEPVVPSLEDVFIHLIDQISKGKA